MPSSKVLVYNPIVSAANHYIFLPHQVQISKHRHIDVLQSIDSDFPEARLPEYAEDFAAARHLSKHIWPSKFHIEVTSVSRNDRRNAIDTGIASVGKINTPKSLKAVLPLLKDVLQKHRIYKYTRTLHHIAPSKVEPFHILVIDMTYALRFFSSYSTSSSVRKRDPFCL